METKPSIDPPRIEIKTLANEVGRGDQQLADLLNAGWEILNVSATSVVVYAVDAPNEEVKHYEVIKLTRLVEPEPVGEVAAVAEISLTPNEQISLTPSPKGEGRQAVVTEETLGAMAGIARAALEASPLDTPEEEEITPDEQSSLTPSPKGEGRQAVVGTVFGMDLLNDAEREPVETVTFNHALRSGKYTPEELSAIGDREVVAAGMRAVWQRQQYGGRSWAGLVNRLPSAVLA